MIIDFASHLRKRREQQAASAVAEVIKTINEPGAVLQLKSRIFNWLELRKQA